MDIFKYINSKDIREYLKDIEYRFSTLEAAWLIHECRSISVEEQHMSWKELISSMPDCTIDVFDKYESLHCFLREYMEFQNKYIDMLRSKQEGTVYTCGYIDMLQSGGMCEYVCNMRDNNFSQYDYGTIFTEYEKCLDYIKGKDSDEQKFYIEKRWLEAERGHFIKCSIDREGIIMGLDPSFVILSDREKDVYGYSEWFNFRFPTPFEKGDILYNPCCPTGICGGPFVMTKICTDESVSPRNLSEYCGVNGMTVYGYFLNDDGSFYSEATSNYMDCEYYTGPLTGKRKILKYLSQYIKGETNLAGLCAEYAANLNILPTTDTYHTLTFSDFILM